MSRSQKQKVITLFNLPNAVLNGKLFTTVVIFKKSKIAVGKKINFYLIEILSIVALINHKPT